MGGTVLCNAPVTVYDKDQDGRYTMGDAFAALHEMYYSGGASGYEEIDTTRPVGSINSGVIVQVTFLMS